MPISETKITNLELNLVSVQEQDAYFRERGAVTSGYSTVEKRHWSSGTTYREAWTFIRYFFDASGDEIGNYSEKLNHVTLFEPPRKWAAEFKAHVKHQPLMDVGTPSDETTQE